MQASLESSALYVLVAAVPLLQNMDAGMASPSVLMTTAWCLAAAFGGWMVLSRRARRPSQHAA